MSVPVSGFVAGPPTTGENGSSRRLTALPKIPGQSKVPVSCFPTRGDSCHSHAIAQAEARARYGSLDGAKVRRRQAAGALCA